jgi:hypothetical protein
MKFTANTTSIKKPMPKMSQGLNEVSWNDINVVLAAIKNGSVVSDLALFHAGYNRAQVDALYAAVTTPTGVCKPRVGIREADGIPVWDSSAWMLPARVA